MSKRSRRNKRFRKKSDKYSKNMLIPFETDVGPVNTQAKIEALQVKMRTSNSDFEITKLKKEVEELQQKLKLKC